MRFERPDLHETLFFPGEWTFRCGDISRLACATGAARGTLRSQWGGCVRFLAAAAACVMTMSSAAERRKSYTGSAR